MPSAHSVRTWIVNILACACTVAAGAIFTRMLMDRGATFGTAVLAGAYYGFLVVWVPLLVGALALRGLKRLMSR